VKCDYCDGEGRVPFEGTPGAYYRDGERYDPPGWEECPECHGGRIDYFVVQDFAQKHRVSFNETAAMVRAALAETQRSSSQATNPPCWKEKQMRDTHELQKATAAGEVETLPTLADRLERAALSFEVMASSSRNGAYVSMDEWYEKRDALRAISRRVRAALVTSN
jgi:hypothetical protein